MVKSFILINLLIVSLLISKDNFSENLRTAKKQVVVCFDDGFYGVYKYAFPVLKHYKVPFVIGLIASYIKPGTPRQNASAYSYLNQGEIKQMLNQSDVEIASHSVHHLDLGKITPERAKYEIAESKVFLESLFNQEVNTFIYPYGSTNSYIISLVKNSGYKLARSCRWGEVNLWTDRYLIPIKEVRMSTTITEIIDHIKNNSITVLVFHRITPNPMVFTDFGLSKFNQLVSMLASSPTVQFVTFKELYQQWWQEITMRYIVQKDWYYKPKDLFQTIELDKFGTTYPIINQ
ncbi:MAG: polysaccharide deacetylase family protein [candidate division WOR-3 bacterium]|nr:polysaccharide deacetylase family protein [candidate division WOR-3 bacterium]